MPRHQGGRRRRFGIPNVPPLPASAPIAEPNLIRTDTQVVLPTKKKRRHRKGKKRRPRVKRTPEERKAHRKAYMRAWRKAHPEKVKAYQKKYRAKLKGFGKMKRLTTYASKTATMPARS